MKLVAIAYDFGKHFGRLRFLSVAIFEEGPGFDLDRARAAWAASVESFEPRPGLDPGISATRVVARFKSKRRLFAWVARKQRAGNPKPLRGWSGPFSIGEGEE